MKYAFIERHEGEHSVRRLCKVMAVHPSGYYAWKVEPMSFRGKDDQRLLGLLKHAWLESGGVYGYRKLTMDMRDLGETCGKHRVARLLKLEGLRSQTGYRRRPGSRGGKPAVVAPNHLQRRFTVSKPNQSWVTDMRSMPGNPYDGHTLAEQLEQATIHAGPLAVTRALRNLLINAATHGQSATVTVTHLGNRAVVRIVDTGPGIPEDRLNQVFEPFFRIDIARQRSFPGAGLGMAIAREIITRFEGEITVRNRQPRGLEQVVSFKNAETKAAG